MINTDIDFAVEKSDTNIGNYSIKENIFTVHALPYWRGIQEKPCQPLVKNLVLTTNSENLITQIPSDFLNDQIVAAYAKEDYNFITMPPGSSGWSNAILKKNVDFFSKYLDTKVKRVLEIGAGSLHLAKCLVDKYSITEYIVFDPSVKEQSDNPNITLHREYFIDAGQIKDKVDFAISISCLEHLPDPLQFLKILKSSLVPETGLAYISFPDIEEQFKIGDLGALLHEHINYFTLESASALIEKAGFIIVAYEQAESTLRFVIQAATKPIDKQFQKKNCALSNCVDNNNHTDFLDNTVKNFQINFLKAKNKIYHAINKGEKIAIHGACNTSYNFLLLANLDKEPGIYIFDGDITKKSKFLSSIDKPIFHVDDLFYKNIDSVYIAAMTFYNEIKQFLIERHNISPNRIFPLFEKLG